MKEATITLDHDELEEILREHVKEMFPTLQISSILGLGYGDVTIRLRKPIAVIPAAPEEFPPERPQPRGDDEVQF